METLLYIGSDFAPTYLSIIGNSALPPCTYYSPIPKEVLEIGKLQRHNPTDYRTTVNGRCWMGWYMNVAGYSSAALAWDWLRIAIGYVKGFDW